MTTRKLTALFLAVFAITSHAATYYVLAGTSSGKFTARITSATGTVVGTANQSIQTVINAIRSNANATATTIQFGDGTNMLDIGTEMIIFGDSTSLSPHWGTITIQGKITSANSDLNCGTICLVYGNYGNLSVTSTADIANTTSGSFGNAVYNTSTGTVTINGGTVSAATGHAVGCSGGGGSSSYKVTVSGNAKVTSAYSSVFDDGGTINNSGCSVQITGGIVENTSGIAVYLANGSDRGRVSISGTAKVTAASTKTTIGTIYFKSSSSSTVDSLEITGGIVENTAANGNAVYIASKGGILLSGDPAITGTIMKSSISTGVLRVDNNFSPTSSKTYNLGFGSCSDGTVAVSGGAAFKASFSPSNLSVNGNNLVLSCYAVEKNGTTYTITRGTGYTSIQSAIDNVRTQANTAAATIQFGSGGSNVLDIGTEYISLDGSTTLSPRWGAITLTGKITSAYYDDEDEMCGTICLSNGASITSTADIANTNNYGYAIYNASTGAVTISNGTVSAKSYSAIHNTSTGAINISGGTVQATKAVYNLSSGTVTISGGTLQATGNGGNAVWNTSTGKITVSGINTKLTSVNTFALPSIGGTINNYSTGTVEITGGTVENTSTGIAVWNNSTGTLTISGGSVTATSGSAVRNNGTGVAVTITGGTVSATTGTAVLNQSTGTVTIIGGTVTAGTGGTKYTNNNTGGTIIEWSNPSVKTYTAGTNANINILPATATAAWLNKEGGAGIDWVNGTKNGFIALSGVTVNKANPTVTALPTAAAITYGAALSTSTLTGGTATPAGTFAWTAPATIPTATNSGYSVTFTPTDATNYNAIVPTQMVAITVSKASGLTATAPGNQEISSGNLSANTFDLSTITLNKSDHGTLSYSLGAFANANSVLSAQPSISGSTLTYTGTGKTSGTATQAINISSQNYTDATVTITFEATPKTEVAISGITAQNSYVYDGTPKSGYTGTPTGTISGGGAYTGNLAIAYTGSGSYNSTTPPTNAGEYVLTISVPSDNASYTGELRHEFSIAKATPSFGTPAAVSTTYTPSLTLGSLTIPTGYSWNAPATTLNAGNSQNFAATYTQSANHNPVTGSITVNVAKAAGTFGTPSPISTTYAPSLTLSDLTIGTGYAWNTPSTPLAAGSNQSFAATYTDPSGNYNSASGTVTVSVAKAAGTFGTVTAISTTYTPTLKLSDLTLTAGYSWNAPTTSLSAGNNQSFPATYNQGSNYEPASGSITVNVAKADPDMAGISFPNASLTYDGQPHSIFISGTLHSGVSVSYTGNGQTNAGEYTVTATFDVADPATHNVPTAMTAMLKIEKASYDMTGIAFADKTATYNGAAHSIYIGGTLPSGVTVSYTGNEQTEIGQHIVTATFAVADLNHNTPAAKTATLTIILPEESPSSSSSSDEEEPPVVTPSSSSSADEEPPVVTPSSSSSSAEEELPVVATPSSSSADATPSSSSADATPSSSSGGETTPSSSSVGETTPSSSSVGETTPSSSSVGETTPSSSSIDATPSSSSGTETPIFTNRENPRIGRIGVQTGVYIVRINSQTTKIAVK
ncbi:hypothetical protein R83H12_01149 [Fibrobacteria bacterium R8-3-H12]